MLNQLRYFQAVVRRNSFSEAAEDCHISQSAISQQIRALERELGVTLLQRQGRHFTLTPAGEHFYRKSLVLVADWDRLVQETVRLARRDLPQLRVGYLRSYSGSAVRVAVARYAEAYPDVEIRLTAGNHEELYDLLRTGEADLVVSDQRRAFSPDYVNVPLAYRRCWAEIAARNPMSALKTVSTEDLKNTPCVVISSREQEQTEETYYREILGLQGEFLFAGSLEEARLLALQVGGYVLVDEEPGSPDQGGTAVRVLILRGGRPIRQRYCAFWKADREAREQVEAFAEALKEAFGGPDAEDEEAAEME